MRLLRCVIDHFVAPPGGPRPAAHEDFASPGDGPSEACAEPASRTPPGVALLAAAGDARPLAAALGLSLAGRFRAPLAMICVWTAGLPAGGPRGKAPASPAARRLAAALHLRGLCARASGRLVCVALPADPVEAADGARRAMAAAAGATTVLALGGPRNVALDELLFEQDLVVVAPSSAVDPALARFAARDVAAGHRHVCVCDVALTPVARALSVAGLGVSPSARRTLAGPLEALP